MTSRKERLTVTVDPEFVTAGQQAVAAGLADSMSSWVNAAMSARATHDRRLRSLSEAVMDYEAQFGEITPEEIAAHRRADREAALVVRSPRPKSAQGPPESPGRGAA